MPIFTTIRPAAVLAALLLSSPLAAQTVNPDVRCLMLSNMFARTAPVDQARLAADQARLFYLGRVSVKIPPAQVPAMMSAAMKSIDPNKAGTDMNACLATVQSSVARIKLSGEKAKAADAVTPKGR